MSTVPQSFSDQPNPSPTQSASRSTIVMGRLDFFSVLLRSIWGELFKIQHRLMTIILAIIAVVIVILSTVIFAVPIIIAKSEPVSSFLPPTCSSLPPGTTGVPCLNHPATQQDLAQAQRTKQQEINADAASLQFPNVLDSLATVIRFIGVIVLIILAGSMVGGEYSAGSIRLLLTRGPTRLQFLLAKIGALLLCAVVTTLVLLIVGAIATEIFSLLIGISGNAPALSGSQISHMVLYTLLTMFDLLFYSLLAIALAILGKSPAAGIAGAIVWWFLEGVLGNVLILVGTLNPGSFGDFLKAIPNYFPGNNVDALLNYQVQYWGGHTFDSPISNVQAILVVLAYTVVFIAVPWWVNHTRDITN